MERAQEEFEEQFMDRDSPDYPNFQKKLGLRLLQLKDKFMIQFEQKYLKELQK